MPSGVSRPLDLLRDGANVMIAVGSTILYVLAKKRQWDVRKSLVRVSRRLTGRGQGDVATAEERRKSGRHGAVRLDSSTKTKTKVDVEKSTTKEAAKVKTTEIEMETRPKKAWKAVMPPAWKGRA